MKRSPVVKSKTKPRPARAMAIVAPRPTSARKLAANRRNALRSTGPRTVQGKARSAQNALRHGLSARMSLSPVLPGECEATYEIVRQELKDEFHPRTAMEAWLIDVLAQQLWRLMRAADVERRLVALEERRMLEAVEAGQEEPLMIEDGTDDAEAPDASLPALPAHAPRPAQVLARIFAGGQGESNAMLCLHRYERGMQSMIVRLLVRLQALRKRPNEDLCSVTDREAFREAREKGWPSPPPPPPPPPRPRPSGPEPDGDANATTPSRGTPQEGKGEGSSPTARSPHSHESHHPSPISHRGAETSPNGATAAEGSPDPTAAAAPSSPPKTNPPPSAPAIAKPPLPIGPSGSTTETQRVARQNEPTAALERRLPRRASTPPADPPPPPPPD